MFDLWTTWRRPVLVSSTRRSCARSTARGKRQRQDGEEKNDEEEVGPRPDREAHHRGDVGGLYEGNHNAQPCPVSSPRGRPGPLEYISLGGGRSPGAGTCHARGSGRSVAIAFPGAGHRRGGYLRRV